MSVSDQLFVSHFLIPQRLRVMISQILLTCLSSRIGTHLLECMASGHCNHFFPLCQFSRNSTLQINAHISSIFPHNQRPCSPNPHLSKAKARQLWVYGVRTSSFEKPHLAISSCNLRPMVPSYHHRAIITNATSSRGHITVDQRPHLSEDILFPHLSLSLPSLSLIII